jgi:hypothetical protein
MDMACLAGDTAEVIRLVPSERIIPVQYPEARLREIAEAEKEARKESLTVGPLRASQRLTGVGSLRRPRGIVTSTALIRY